MKCDHAKTGTLTLITSNEAYYATFERFKGTNYVQSELYFLHLYATMLTDSIKDLVHNEKIFTLLISQLY